MRQTPRLNPEGPKMSACSDFVEHIWKPRSCKNCFCLRSDHPPAVGQAPARAGSLPPPPRLPPRPETGRLDDDGSPYSKPTIAVKPTVMSSEASDTRTEARTEAGPQVIWRRAPGQLPLPKQDDAALEYPGGFGGGPRPPGPPARAAAGPPSPEPGEKSPAFPAARRPAEEPASAQESLRRKLAALAGTAPGCPPGPPSEDGADPRCPAPGDGEGGEYCSIRDCCPGSPAAEAPEPAEGAPACARPRAEGARRGSDGGSPRGPHPESEYCALRKDPAPGRRPADSSERPGPAGDPRAPAPPEPIYAESTKRKKAAPGPSRPRGRAGAAWAPKGPSGPRRDGAGPGPAPPGAATLTVVAAHPEEDRRTIALSSPDSAVGVQWPRGPASPEEAEDPPEPGAPGRPAIPPKLSRGSPGGSPASPRASPPAPLAQGGPAEPAAASPPAADPRRPPFQAAAAWSRIEEEEEAEQGLWAQSWGRRTGNGPAHLADAATWHRLHPGGDGRAGAGMSKSASFAFEFPKDRSGMETFSPPPPPPKSRHLLKMNKSSSDLEKASHGSAESLSPSFRGGHVSFTSGSTDSLASDSRTCSDGGAASEPTPSPTTGGRQLFAPVPFPSGSSEEVCPSGSPQPPPLPQKKIVSRAASSPDGFFFAQGSPKPRPASPKLTLSHSETNVCVHDEPPFSCSPSSGLCRPHAFSSSEPLERAFPSNGAWAPASGLAGGRGDGVNPNPQGPPAATPSSSSSSSGGSQLHSLLNSISSKEGTYAKLGGLYTQSLARLVAKCEDLFMGGQKKELHFDENNWSLFKLTCNKPCCDAGDAIYYCATCSEDPGSTYAVKICKSPEPQAAAACCGPAVPAHFNIQQDCGRFVASVPASMLGEPAGGPAAERDRVVVITREVPDQTAADFVRASAGSHGAEPEAYERRVCFLLLQLCAGLEHLQEHGVVHRDLCLENLLLARAGPAAAAPAPGAPPPLPRLLISNFLRAKRRPDPRQRRSQARLAPEVVSAAQYRRVDEFQAGILIYELLHQPNPFEARAGLRERAYRAEDLPPLPARSLYSPGLARLAQRLLEADPRRRIRVAEARRALQCLLWGPRRELLARGGEDEGGGDGEAALRGALHNWIHMKRALMMMKFAEKAVDRRRGVELEDWLCCQYLAAAEPGALLHSLRLLQLL
ncbi:inactive tyrosine-protein kinase PRAG1 [Perognathus longimembris pacificus]|uniref:inactive tyrosine-protein kinase PRAG1 n=1 Tax=Perognathus longimembris pacificus TaxID=214514 RepID=UPI0020187744|nr:inactive tyrosine-protein kinase PRAG1 [Perognathus longimembris pacificus]